MPRHSHRSSFRLWSVVAGAVLLISFVAQAQARHTGVPRGERHELRHEIFQLEDTWRDAVTHRNVQVLDSLLADDYIGIMSNGMIQSKQQTLENLRNGTLHFNAVNALDRKVRFYGGTAVVTSKAEVSGNTSEGDISGNYRYTRVYVRDGHGVWKIVSFEASRIAHESDSQ